MLVFSGHVFYGHQMIRHTAQHSTAIARAGRLSAQKARSLFPILALTAVLCLPHCSSDDNGGGGVVRKCDGSICLAPNGITIRLEGEAELGDTGVIDGITYTVVSEMQLRAMVDADPDDENITKVVTSKVDNMRRLFKSKGSFDRNIASWDTSNHQYE